LRDGSWADALGLGEEVVGDGGGFVDQGAQIVEVGAAKVDEGDLVSEGELGGSRGKPEIENSA